MAVKKKAFSGFQMAWFEMQNKGIDPFTHFSGLEYSGLPQDQIALMYTGGLGIMGPVDWIDEEELARIHNTIRDSIDRIGSGYGKSSSLIDSKSNDLSFEIFSSPISHTLSPENSRTNYSTTY